MKELISKNFGAIIISISVIIAAVLYASTTRYDAFIVQKKYGNEWHTIDHWTGRTQ